MRTITNLDIIVNGKLLKLSNIETTNDNLEGDIALFGNFEDEAQFLAMFGMDIVNREAFKQVFAMSKSAKSEKKEKPVTTTPVKETKPVTTETKPTKTLALNIILPGDLGKVGMSKEFLEKTGTERDAKLIKMDKDGNIVVYDISMMQLAGKCSKAVQEAVEAYMANEITKIKATIAKPAPKAEPKKTEPTPTGKIFNPTNNGKKKAEDTIISNLKEKVKGNWGEFLGEEGKAQLIADLTQRSFSAATAKEIQLTTEKGTLFVHVPHNVYNSNREKWSEVIEAFRIACRKSRLEYSRPRDGKLPISTRAVKKNEL